MDLLQAIVLGIVQGLTEFLPISSSGHLRIVPAFAGWDDPGAAFTAVIQLGTMAAVVLYFRHDLLRIARAWLGSLRDPARRGELDARLGWYLILATIPISILGLAFKDQIENGARDLYIIGTTLIVLGLVLLFAERVATPRAGDRDDHAPRRDRHRLRPGARAGPRRLALRRDDHRRPVPRLRPRRGRALLVPAVDPSRRAERPVRAKGVVDGSAEGAVGVGPTAVATLLAFVVGYASIAFLLKFLTTHTTGVFVTYRVVLGAAVLVLAGTHTIA